MRCNRVVALLACGFACVFACNAAHAQYPTRPVKLVVPYIAGSAPDVVARKLGERLGQLLGQTMVIENRPGAGGNLGSDFIAKAAPDGYTIGIATSSSHAGNMFLYKRVPYDPVRDFTAISLAVSVPSLMVVEADHPARTVRDVVALARARPGALTYASGGVGSIAHLSGAAFASLIGADLLHVPYKGAPEIVASVLAKQVITGFPTFPTAYPMVKAGKLRALATTGEQRNPALPEVPTMVEAYPPGYVLDGWFALVGPAGMPATIVERLHAEIARMQREPVFAAKLTADGTEIRGSASPAEFAAYLKAEQGKWEKVVRAAGATLE